jgi:hypothetical protein
MAHRQGAGHASNTGQRPLRFETIVKIAVAAALVVQTLDIVLIFVRAIVRGNAGTLDFVSVVRGQLSDIISQGALFGAVLAAYAGNTSQSMVVRLGALVFVASVLETFVDTVLVSLLNNFSPNVDIVVTLVNGLFLVTTFLGFVMVLRLFHRETILPGVDFRL